MKRFFVLIVIAFFFPPVVAVRSQRFGKDVPVAFWEGKIRVEKAYDGEQGKYKWNAEYRVLLREEKGGPPYFRSTLSGLELDYNIDTDLDLNKDCYGVYQNQSHDWRMLGKASGRLRHDSSVRAMNIFADSSRYGGRLAGVANFYESFPKGEENHGYEPNSFEQYNSVGLCNLPRSYFIAIDLRDRSWPVDEVLSIYQGIQRTGDGLVRQTNPFSFLDSGLANGVDNPHICGSDGAIGSGGVTRLAHYHI